MQLPIPYFWENLGHVETAARALASHASVPSRHERISTPDDDFLDLYWHMPEGDGKGLVVYCHGLAGTAHSTYIALTAQALKPHLPWSSLAWNYRGCSAEINRQPRFYHLGETQDLMTVLNHAKTKGFSKFLLIGFSAGGSIILNFLGKHPAEALALGVVAATAISTPLDLEGCAKQLETPGSLYYNHRFCAALNEQVRQKAAAFGARFPIGTAELATIKTLRAFDDHVTAPLHGFASAADYYNQCSAKKLLDLVPVPTLIWAAQNDPFLSSSCFLSEGHFRQNQNVAGLFPAHGGHCGYALCNAEPILAALAPEGAWGHILH